MFRFRHGRPSSRNRINCRIKKILQYRSVCSRVNYPVEFLLVEQILSRSFRYYQIRAGVKFAPRLQPTTKIELKSEFIPSAGMSIAFDSIN